jgi:hypothetical protein
MEERRHDTPIRGRRLYKTTATIRRPTAIEKYVSHFLADNFFSWDGNFVAKRFEYQFEWDTAKARQNLKEHRVCFEASNETRV